MPLSPGPVLVLGATSAIARSVALALAAKGCSLVLAGRDEPELERIKSDLEIRCGVSVSHLVFDAEDETSHKAFWAQAEVDHGPFKGVVLAFGYLGDQQRAQEDWGEARSVLERNFVSAASILHVVAQSMETRGEGWIVVLSSVAGDRGRMSNYVYGSAKGGLTIFLQGLRSRLQKAGVHVMTVKPGPVDTAMTFGMDRLPLLADPQTVGKAIVAGLAQGKDVLYVPTPWRLIMFVLRSVPEKIFKKTSL